MQLATCFAESADLSGDQRKAIVREAEFILSETEFSQYLQRRLKSRSQAGSAEP